MRVRSGHLVGRSWWGMVCAVALVVSACGPAEEPGEGWTVGESNNVTSGTNNVTNSTNNTTSTNNTNNTTSTNNTTGLRCPLKAPPKLHRAAANVCDDVRSDTAPMPDGPVDGGYIQCDSHDDCTAGKNGRCTGNSHDGWYCTYDACAEDSECGGGKVCLCGGGWRSDNNVCLAGNCQTDADCGDTGFCSPTQGDCGEYGGTVGFYCHTCDDECVDDSDCGDGDPWGSTCRYNPAAGKWTCSDSQCAG